jgi:hypothetical protein
MEGFFYPFKRYHELADQGAPSKFRISILCLTTRFIASRYHKFADQDAPSRFQISILYLTTRFIASRFHFFSVPRCRTQSCGSGYGSTLLTSVRAVSGYRYYQICPCLRRFLTLTNAGNHAGLGLLLWIFRANHPFQGEDCNRYI